MSKAPTYFLPHTLIQHSIDIYRRQRACPTSRYETFHVADGSFEERAGIDEKVDDLLLSLTAFPGTSQSRGKPIASDEPSIPY